MPTAEENSPPYTDADYYGFFMTSLFGVLDDAELSGYDRKGIALLREAQEVFWAEFQRRHPGAWNPRRTDG